MIENKTVFRNTILDMQELIAGRLGSLVLSDNNQEVKFSKHVDLVGEFINVNLNDKKVLNKIYTLLKNKSLEDYDSYGKVSECITEYVQSLIYEEDFDLVQMNRVDPIDIFKGVTIEFDCSNKSIIERVLEYVTISEKLMDTKLFIFVNLKEFFDNEEIVNIYNKLLLNKTRFILLQSKMEKTIDCREVLHIIDEDFCEI